MSELGNSQAPFDCAEGTYQTVENPSWHNLLISDGVDRLQREELESAPESLLSETTFIPEQVDVTNIFHLDSIVNCDSGNFSFSESSKGKLNVSPNGHDLHRRFVQLNTELYHTKTELLTYKYKWNEIRNEVEVRWNKKLQRIVDEKIGLQQELDDLKKQLGQFHCFSESSRYLETAKLQSDLEQLRVKLDCKDRANTILKEKITEQYCGKEKLSLELKKLEKVLLEIKNDLLSTKTSEDWFRNELHACQNSNAKLKEYNLQLENKLSQEKAHSQQLNVKIQHVIRNAEKIERQVYNEKKNLLVKLSSIKAFDKLDQVPDLVLTEHISQLNDASKKISFLTEINNKHEYEKEQFLFSIQVLNNTLSNQDNLTQAYKAKEAKAICKIAILEDERMQLKGEKNQLQQENNQLRGAIARHGFTNRELDVSISHLRAQLKVLSINFEKTRQTLGVKEFALEKLEQEYNALQDRYQQLKKCGMKLNEQLRMNESLATERYEKLFENFRKIQSKNLDLELKLGQCSEVNDRFRRSEEVVKQLRIDINELQGTFDRDVSVCGRMTPKQTRDKLLNNELKKQILCGKHGTRHPDDDSRELQILLKVVESEHRQKLKRYELNNRTLLRKVKEHSQARKQIERKLETLQQDITKVTSLQCDVARLREKTILLEADLASFTEECTTLKNEKSRLLALLESNCVLVKDEDIWSTFLRIFTDLRDKQKLQNENDCLKEQLQVHETKILQLEQELKVMLSSSEEKRTMIEDLNITSALQRVEIDEIHSELTVNFIQLDDSQRMIHELSGDRSSLQTSAGEQQMNQSKLRNKIDSLRQQLNARDVQIKTALDKIKMYQNSEQILTQSRYKIFEDLQFLREEIVAEKIEKQELQEVVKALKEKVFQLVEYTTKNCQNSSLPGSTNNSIPSIVSTNSNRSINCGASLVEPVSLFIGFNEQTLQALLDECSRRDQTFQPLQESITSLRSEMNHLNTIVRQNGHRRYRDVSLLEELQDATNGNYNHSR
ncbi:uncharacterized protein LOC131436372 [Malaya genurostris]|uniref:uncharacterized protein LOC131436372 n=1 Tax=Malaya genurostris TaxID=325434 RepID=UPI0026F3AF12|nr:uncharacterized protein LOC131436372 [Malaya genurostris]